MATVPLFSSKKISERVVSCPACEDTGIVLLTPAPTCGADLMDRSMPCVCPAGDQCRRFWDTGCGEVPDGRSYPIGR